MAVASTPLVAAPSCPAWAKRRRGFPPQFDGEPCEPAEEEDMWLCRADGRARSTAELKRLATAARMRCARRADASRRDQQARDQRRRQRAQHDRRAAPAVAKTVRPERVAAAAAALQPEPDDVKIIFGSQARIPPGAAHPRHTHPTLRIPGHDALQQPSEPQWCLRELTRCAALVLRAPRPRSFVSTTTPCSVRGEKR